MSKTRTKPRETLVVCLDHTEDCDDNCPGCTHRRPHARQCGCSPEMNHTATDHFCAYKGRETSCAPAKVPVSVSKSTPAR